MRRHGFKPPFLDAYDRVWAPAASPDERLAALKVLTESALNHGSSDENPPQSRT